MGRTSSLVLGEVIVSYANCLVWYSLYNCLVWWKQGWEAGKWGRGVLNQAYVNKKKSSISIADPDKGGGKDSVLVEILMT